MRKQGNIAIEVFISFCSNDYWEWQVETNKVLSQHIWVVDATETVNDNNQKISHGSARKYTNNKRKGQTGWNNFSNGWSEEGRKRYCELMMLINKNRAYYNSSFDKRMLKYAKVVSERQKRKKQRRIAVTKYILPTKRSLPSAESIRNKNPDETAIKANMELMNHDDTFSDKEDEVSQENEIGARASIWNQKSPFLKSVVTILTISSHHFNNQ